MTVAHLGLAVDSCQVVSATPALEKMTAAAAKAEAAALALSRAEHTKAQAVLSAAKATGTATKEEIAAAIAAVRKTRADYDAARAMQDVAAAAHKQAAALATVGAAQNSVTASTQVNTAAINANNSAMRMANAQRTNLIFQLQDIGVSLASGMNPLMVAAQQGSQISMIYGPGEGGIGRAFAETGKMATSFAARLLPLGTIVAGLTVGFAAMTTEINRNAEAQVSMGDVLTATWQLAAESIVGYMQPALDWLAGVWDYIAPGINLAMNALIGSFDIAFRNIGTIWSMLPAALGDVAIQAANGIIQAMEDMINGALSLLNDFVGEANQFLPEGLKLSPANSVSLDALDNPFAGRDQALTDQLNKNGEDVRSKVLAGGYTADIGARAQENARARELEEIGEAATKASEGLNVFDVMMRDVGHLLTEASDPFTELQHNMDTLGALLASGEISWDQYGKAVAKANLQMASGTLDAIAQITGVLAGAFEDNKMLAAANIVVSTAAGAMKALEQGGAFGFPMAAAITAAGAAQLASVMSAKPGSSSISGAGNSATSTAAAAVPQNAGLTIDLKGLSPNSLFSGDQVAGILEGLKEYLGTQGQELAINYKGA